MQGTLCAFDKTRTGTSLEASAASTAGLSNGTGRNASASQGLTAVTTTANSTANSDIIHNSAAAGSSAADLSSSSAAQSQTGSSKDRHSSNSSTGGDVSATGPGKAANVVSDSSEVSTTATPDKVSGLILASCLVHHAFFHSSTS